MGVWVLQYYIEGTFPNHYKIAWMGSRDPKFVLHNLWTAHHGIQRPKSFCFSNYKVPCKSILPYVCHELRCTMSTGSPSCTSSSLGSPSSPPLLASLSPTFPQDHVWSGDMVGFFLEPSCSYQPPHPGDSWWSCNDPPAGWSGPTHLLGFRARRLSPVFPEPPPTTRLFSSLFQKYLQHLSSKKILRNTYNRKGTVCGLHWILIFWLTEVQLALNNCKNCIEKNENKTHFEEGTSESIYITSWPSYLLAYMQPYLS